MKKLKFIWHYAKPYEKQAYYMLINVAIYAFFILAAPLIISYMQDNIISGIPFENQLMQDFVDAIGGIAYLQDHLWIGSILVVICYIMIGIAIYKRSMQSGRLSESFAMHVRNHMYDHLQKLSFHYHKQKDSGDLIQRSTSDIETIRRFLAGQLAEMMYAVLIVGIAMAILLSLNGKLALYSVSLMPFVMAAAYLFFRKAKKIFLDCDIAESKMTTVLQENLNAMRVVKAFHQEQREIDKFETYNEAYRKKYFDLMHALGIFWSGTDMLCLSQILLMIMMGVFMALNNEITAGTFFVFLMYESMIIWPMRQLGRILADMGKVSVSIGRIEEVLNEPCEELEKGLTSDIQGDIVFDHVSFHYDDSDQMVLQDVSFHIPKGTKVAIMGPTGSGKSSLVHLLTGIYDYQKGSIQMDGIELKDISRSWLRKHVQIVLQEPFLFSKTIYENIHLANMNANKEDIERVAHMASIHDTIMEFDQGYDTSVGEKGVTLSGGQKQRVAIARTLLSNSPIIIFDDSLSALDTKTDRMIQEALDHLEDHLTTLMITHRVSSARKADLIIILQNGHVAQMGTHEELIKQDGLYQRIYKIQTKGGEA